LGRGVNLHPWLPNLGYYAKMLSTLGFQEVGELLREAIPQGLLVDDGVFKSLPRYALMPWNIERTVKSKLLRNPLYEPSRVFAGGPICPHYVHPVTLYIISRGEFLTAYTPYQPEVNQGVLQALFEYQSLLSELLGVEVVNAGMYDGATALGEAALMAVRIKRKKSILMPESLHPQYKAVLRTYLYGPDVKLLEYKTDFDGSPNLEDLEEKVRSLKPSGAILELPTSEGVLHDKLKEAIEIAHLNDALAISLVEPLVLALVKPPGEIGSDIVVAEGQSLGLPMSGGGSRLGVFGIKWDRTLLRQLPGRLVGSTLDAEGKRGFMLILQTREQHIKREKATSNITTNASLNAIAAAVHLALLGRNGLSYLSALIYERTQYALKLMRQHGINLRYPDSKHFKNVTYDIENPKSVFMSACSQGILPFSILAGSRVVSCFTELHAHSDIDALVRFLSKVEGGD